jgi:hypothetical protein
VDIPFYLPYVFCPGSLPEDDAQVRQILLGCLSSLKQETRANLVRKESNGLSCHVFELPHLFVLGHNSPDDQLENGKALVKLLDALVALNVAWLMRHPCIPLYETGVYYGRTDEWEPYPSLVARGYGDCKSLGALRVAEYIMQGVNARHSHRWLERKNDKFVMYHILAETSPGVYEDPSKILGMNLGEFSYF